MRKFTVIPLLLLILLVALPATYAQEETAECFLEFPDESTIDLGEATFADCAWFMLDAAYGEDLYEAYGYWGDIYTYVGESGDIYYVDENDEWVYWDSLDLESEEEIPTVSEDSEPLTIDQLIQVAEFDINVFWQNTFDSYELEYSEPEVRLIPRGDLNSGCGTVGESTGPVYCSADGTMYIPIDFMADQYSRIGDYAVVVIMAHEWGHAIEDQLGLFDGDLVTQDTELIADCFAGAYTNYLLNESENAILDEGDIEEGMTSLFEAGDDLPWFDENAHGSGEQRIAAFQVGLDSDPAGCLE